MARRTTLERHQYLINNNSPKFIFSSGRSILRARFLEVSPKSIKFSVAGWKEGEIAVEVAEQILPVIMSLGTVRLGADDDFLHHFSGLVIGGVHLPTVVGHFTLMEEGYYYYLRLDKIM